MSNKIIKFIQQTVSNGTEDLNLNILTFMIITESNVMSADYSRVCAIFIQSLFEVVCRLILYPLL